MARTCGCRPGRQGERSGSEGGWTTLEVKERAHLLLFMFGSGDDVGERLIQVREEVGVRLREVHVPEGRVESFSEAIQNQGNCSLP